MRFECPFQLAQLVIPDLDRAILTPGRQTGEQGVECDAGNGLPMRL
jgi:hypothetical protein